ncbi:MAG: 16S rRNA (cytidine1402-2'-O)-methyltransferase [Motiliproteus sp.]|jgi:16S rRNA (cytidine1402-2'-O)-methyltransferase
MTDTCLYIVSTPIGNLGDISARALDILQSVQLIAAEDTRHSGRLLQHFCISTPMWALHDHNERAQADKIVQRLSEGENIALISDAGTPLISDPGYHLVRKVREAGFRVVPIPGACALVAALSASGLPTNRFAFEGFLPAKSQARLQRLEKLVADDRTLMFYESPHRVIASLEAMLEVFGADRYVVMARELTKTFETIKGDTLGQLIDWMKADHHQQKGEFVILVQGAVEEPDTEALSPEESRVLNLLLEELSLKQAAALAAKICNSKKKKLYQAALALKSAD